MTKLNETSVQFVKGVGPARKKLFANLGIETVEDLLYFFPRRYEDRTQMTPLNKLRLGEFQTVTGKVIARGGHRSWYTKKHVYETVIGDESGGVHCIWFNQPFLENYFHVGEYVVLYGKVEIYKDRLQMVAPEYELISPDKDEQYLSMGRIVPIYSLTRGMSQRYLRKVIRLCLDRYARQLPEALPAGIRQKFGLFDIGQSITSIHFPEEPESQQKAYRRIAFEEFFFFQISVVMRRLSIVRKKGIAHAIAPDLMARFNVSFPFALTGAQQRVIREIAGDMKKDSPMLRLLQGDVGSGKTLVAFFGCVAAFQNGFQSAIMAPTEILARQHFENIQKMIDQNETTSNSKGPKIRAALLIGSLKKEEKDAVCQDVKDGKIDLLIGTHALLEETVAFKNLSYVVIDEQHKFGVRQRALLSDKGINPDVLIMTATPIPRTLCLTLYGDLDVSVINEMPKGRGKIETKFFYSDHAQDVYTLVSQLVKSGRQAFIVYPLVEESQKLDLKAAVASFHHFEKNEFKDFRLGLVHGQMNRKETQTMMERFKKKEIDILVATTVVEVGVDVPNASVMVIEHAERFGLAQLHQLRGRIGRGLHDSLCLLIADPVTEESQARLKAVLSTTDGFKIAEEDLIIRGPGEFFGRHQHGLNELKIANPTTQLDILELARKEAIEMTSHDPQLQKPEHRDVKMIVQKRYPAYLAMVSAG